MKLAQYQTEARLQAVDVRVLSESLEVIASVNPDAASAFLFDAVVPSEYPVEVTRAGYSRRIVPVDFDPGGAMDLGEFSLAHESTGDDAATLSGRVTLEREDSLSGTKVDLCIVPEDLPYVTTTTDASGAFSVPASSAERYTIVLERPGFDAPELWGPFIWNAETVTFVDEAGTTPEINFTRALGPDADADADLAGVASALDNCLETPNADQGDLDQDGQGDACDVDVDGLNDHEEVQLGTDPRNADTDGDRRRTTQFADRESRGRRPSIRDICTHMPLISTRIAA